MDKSKNKKAWYKKWWIWVIAIVVIIAIGSSGADKKDGDSTNSDNASNSASQNSESPENKKTEDKAEFSVNETATFDDRSITVKEVQRNYDTGNQFAQPESGKEFVIVTVEIANNGKSKMDYNTFEFEIQDSNGVQQSESFMALSEGKLNSGSLASGGKVTGKLAYEVPKDDNGLKLLYQNFNFFSNKLVTFNLQ